MLRPLGLIAVQQLQQAARCVLRAAFAGSRRETRVWRRGGRTGRSAVSSGPRRSWRWDGCWRAELMRAIGRRPCRRGGWRLQQTVQAEDRCGKKEQDAGADYRWFEDLFHGRSFFVRSNLYIIFAVSF